MDGEDQKTRDARVEKLWRVLDTRSEGQLNLNGLKQGLGKIDHRGYNFTFLRHYLTVKPALKDADTLLQDVMKAVDVNGDGHISFLGMSHTAG